MKSRKKFLAGVAVGIVGAGTSCIGERRFKEAHPGLIPGPWTSTESLELCGRDFFYAMIGEPVVLAILCVSVSLLVVACILLARSAGRSAAWGWMGLLSIYGVAVVAMICWRRGFGSVGGVFEPEIKRK
jgi:hypothetical protein